MVITTENLNQDYEIKGLVRYYLSAHGVKAQLGKDMPMNEAIDFVSNTILVEQAVEKEADAIIGFRINSYPGSGMAATGTNLLFYGTAVKLK